MASSNASGYECVFVDSVIDFECPLCLHVTRDPHLTSCCGQHFCQACIEQILTDQKPCPFCKSATFSTMLDKKQNRKVHELKVYCTRKDHGCRWSGELENLDSHSNTDSGDCQYIKVKCTYNCGERLQKRHMQEHIESCPKHPFTCQHCGFKATYKEILEKHQPKCDDYPSPCPYQCEIGKAIRRCDLEQHLMEQHFTHVSAQLAEKDEQIAELQGTIAELKEAGIAQQNEMDKQVKSILNPVRLMFGALSDSNTQAPMEFIATFPNSNWHNRGSTNHPSVYGPSFYTHPFGCKLLIRFDCFCSSRRDAIMHLISCKGVCDFIQLWPVTCTITAQLLTHAGQVKEYNNWEVKLSLNGSHEGCCLTSGRGLEIDRYRFMRHDDENRYLRVRIDVKY